MRLISPAAVVLTCSLGFADTVVLSDPFNDLNQWKDLSTAITWGGNTTPTSAFTTSGGTASLTSAALASTSYTTTSGLKTFTALDHQFAQPIDHLGNTVTVDFRARWSSVGGNESGRFIVAFAHDYPAGGLDLGLNSRLADFSQPWWARPAYQVRVRSGMSTLLQYGGGLTPLGEFETYNDVATPANPDWWLPGFVSAPGGGSPGTSTAKGWVESAGVLASATLRNYRYVVAPDQQQFWVDDNDDGQFTGAELKVSQDLLSDPNNPNFFNIFNTLSGIRLYWRGASNYNTFLDSLSVTVSPIPEPTTLAFLLLPALLTRRVRRPGRR